MNNELLTHMTISKHFYQNAIFVGLILYALFLPGCSDDFNSDNSNDTPWSYGYDEGEPTRAFINEWIINEGSARVIDLWHSGDEGIQLGADRCILSTKVSGEMHRVEIVARLDKGVTLRAVLEGVAYLPESKVSAGVIDDSGDYAELFNIHMKNGLTYADSFCRYACFLENPNNYLLWQADVPIVFSAKQGASQIFTEKTMEYWLNIVKEGEGQSVIERIYYW
ncbi:MAG: hypothetical protein JXR76_06520 [Deltaproteobacteria bacterium]|nr:hypothetical protein [Deltaproteobacteria bacterium]